MTPTAATASYSLVELGGILGAAASGPLTDHCVDRARLSTLALAVLAVLVGVGLPHADGSTLPLVLGATGAALTVPKVSLPLLARSELLPLAVMGTSGAVIDVVAEAGGTCSGWLIGHTLGHEHAGGAGRGGESWDRVLGMFGQAALGSVVLVLLFLLVRPPRLKPARA